MLTYFDPFGGESINASEDIAKRIQATDLGAEVILCRLSVVYDLAGREAEKCLERAEPKPQYVISLGEGNCNLSFETAAHNRDATPGFPDNSGNIRNYKIIEPEGPISDSMTFPIDELLCDPTLSDKDREWAAISATPGGFVCNNLAFTLGRYLKREFPLTRYGFIHIPSHSCENPDSNRNSADILTKYIRAALKADIYAPRDLPPAPFPRTLREIDQAIQNLKETPTKACRQVYLKELRSNRLKFLKQEKQETKRD